MLQNRWVQIILLGGALVFAISQYLPHFTKKKPAAAALTPTVATVTTAPCQQPDQAPEKKAKAVASLQEYKQMLKLAKNGDWEQDPFGLGNSKQAPAIAAAPPVETVVAQPEISSLPLELESILITGQQRLALVNGSLVQEGDVIYGNKVVEISDDYLILSQMGIQKRLTLYNGTIPVQQYKLTGEVYHQWKAEKKPD